MFVQRLLSHIPDNSFEGFRSFAKRHEISSLAAKNLPAASRKIGRICFPPGKTP